MAGGQRSGTGGEKWTKRKKLLDKQQVDFPYLVYKLDKIQILWGLCRGNSYIDRW